MFHFHLPPLPMHTHTLSCIEYTQREIRSAAIQTRIALVSPLIFKQLSPIWVKYSAFDAYQRNITSAHSSGRSVNWIRYVKKNNKQNKIREIKRSSLHFQLLANCYKISARTHSNAVRTRLGSRRDKKKKHKRLHCKAKIFKGT